MFPKVAPQPSTTLAFSLHPPGCPGVLPHRGPGLLWSLGGSKGTPRADNRPHATVAHQSLEGLMFPGKQQLQEELLRKAPSQAGRALPVLAELTQDYTEG